MPSFQNPQARPALPFRHEGSPLRHARDGDAIAREWQKAQKDDAVLRSQGNALWRLQRQVAKMRSPRFQLDRWHPFKIYNVPPLYCSSPSDSWRTFRVRSGLASWRSMFTTPVYPYSYLEDRISVKAGSDWQGIDPGSTFPYQLPGGFQSDQIAMFNQLPAGLSFEAVEVPSTGTAGVTSTGVHAAEFLINEEVDSVNDRLAEFWIEFDDQNDESNHAFEVSASIKCRMFDTSQPAARPGPLVPNTNQIPIGFVIVRRGSDPASLIGRDTSAIAQDVFDHQIHRYPVGYWNTSLGSTDYKFSSGGMIFRGTWDDAEDWTDSIFYDMCFYPGDTLQRTHAVESPDVTERALLVYNGDPQYNVTEPPFDGSATWAQAFYTKYVA